MRSMKKTNLFNAFILLLFSLSIIGFGGCERESIIKPSTQSEFLELSTYDDYSRLSPEDMDKFMEATGRVHVSLNNGSYQIKETLGAEVNISQQLFEYIKRAYDRTNNLFLSRNSNSSKLSTLRLKTSSFEDSGSGPKTDCMAHAISHISGTTTTYSAANTYYVATYGTDGVPSDKFHEACTHFVSGTTGTTSLLTQGANTNAILVLSVAGGGHAVNAEFYSTTYGTLTYRDYQSNGNVVNLLPNTSTVLRVFKH